MSDDADSDADSDPGPDTASGMAPGSGAPGGPAEAVGQGEHYDDGHFEHEDPGPASAPVAGEFNLKPEWIRVIAQQIPLPSGADAGIPFQVATVMLLSRRRSNGSSGSIGKSVPV